MMKLLASKILSSMVKKIGRRNWSLLSPVKKNQQYFETTFCLGRVRGLKNGQFVKLSGWMPVRKNLAKNTVKVGNIST